MLPDPSFLRQNGFLLIDKPKDITSFKVLELIKQKTGLQKLGHTGTLDPFATGLLVVGVGEALKYLSYLEESFKTYEAILKLGEATDTLDCDGKIIESKSSGPFHPEELGNILKSFLGESLQTPPMFSAKKVDGKKLYELARLGQQIERKPQSIVIKEIELTDYSHPFVAFRVVCSKGTYVRQLGLDFSQKLGTVGHLTALRRVQSGPFIIDGAHNLEEDLKMVPLKKIESTLNFPVLNLNEKESIAIKMGKIISKQLTDGYYLLKEGERFLGVGDVKDSLLSAKRLMRIG